jgi:hypothetical protein
LAIARVIEIDVNIDVKAQNYLMPVLQNGVDSSETPWNIYFVCFCRFIKAVWITEHGELHHQCQNEWLTPQEAFRRVNS